MLSGVEASCRKSTFAAFDFPRVGSLSLTKVLLPIFRREGIWRIASQILLKLLAQQCAIMR